MNIQEMGDQIKVTIPKNREDTIPLTFTVNGESVTVPRGEEVTIPAMFAGVIKNWWKSQFYEEAEDVSKPSEENSSDKKRHLLFEEVYFADDATIPLFENISAEKKAELEINDDNAMSYSNLFKNHRMILYVTENLSGDREKLVLECLDAENLYDPTKGVFATWVFSNSGKFVLAKMGFQAGYKKIVVKADSDIKPTSTRVTCYLEEL